MRHVTWPFEPLSNLIRVVLKDDLALDVATTIIEDYQTAPATSS